MSEPVSNDPSGSLSPLFSMQALVDYICQPQKTKQLQAMFDYTCDVNVLALTLDGEGRNQSILGRTAIAWSVRNRQRGLGPLVDKDKSIAAICLRKSQYSTWFSFGGVENYVRQMKLAEAVVQGLDVGAKFEESRYLAAGVIKGFLLDPTGGAAHYLTKSLYASPRAPRWVSAATGIREIGDHLFLKGIR